MKKNHDNQTIFYPELNEFCRKYLDSSKSISLMDQNLFPQRIDDIQKSIFEQLLLFDAISFRVHGENIPLAVLINFFGKKGFDALVEQEALHFVLWTQNIMHLVDDAKGINPLCWGKFNEGPHTDPIQSIELGLNWVRPVPGRREKSALVKKLLPLYSVSRDGLSEMAVKATESAFLSGKLTALGLDPNVIELTNFPRDKRALMNKCADEVFSYTLMCEERLTSYSNFDFFHLFNDSAKKISSLSSVAGGYAEIAKIQHVPDLKAVFDLLDRPLEKIAKFRNKRSSKKFRGWLADALDRTSGEELTREYIDALGAPTGFFQKDIGKITKAIATTAIGAGIGSLLDTKLAGVKIGAGVLATTVLQPVADFGLDLVDTYLLEGITKGWTPRMFFDDLERWKVESAKAKTTSSAS
ncbi:hypothetical protein QZN06_22330 [Burkholderia multivorans]|uniref:hypothetical protein n=1 Tax=Burkholderia multivorans TaxID=87883 RepID=UPI0007560FDA|nr:hypothetical protein [Burkholderia multivorans]AOK66488.1 hypothetical protein WM33_12605 [Burkholderia multivorans]KVZ77437.1 hypothetical protein WL23_21305 [Burkholderia multivorans]MBU9289858.1 hypothetical protein [Burkholderia multivorans]MDN8011323.1 hypothetical protein [Burkholderia multivorans]